MDFTGERYVPSVGGEIRQEHLHRYALAAELLAGRRVLDIACGEGYGSAILARRAKSVVGVDIAPDAVAHAHAHYAESGRVEFKAGSAAELPLADASVDAIVSFETIEHHEHHEAMMSEFRRVLRPSGLLILSSPNKAIYSDAAGYHNEFHVRELYFDELDRLVRSRFKQVRYFGQRFATGSAIYPLASDGTPAAEAAARALLWTDDGKVIDQRSAALTEPLYFLLVASDEATLPDVPPSLLLSEASDLYLEFKKIARWASGVHHELEAEQAASRERERGFGLEREQLQQRFASAEQQAASVAEKAAAVERELAAHRSLHGEQLRGLHGELARRDQALTDAEQAAASTIAELKRVQSRELEQASERFAAKLLETEAAWQRRWIERTDLLEQERLVEARRFESEQERSHERERLLQERAAKLFDQQRDAQQALAAATAQVQTLQARVAELVAQRAQALADQAEAINARDALAQETQRLQTRLGDLGLALARSEQAVVDARRVAAEQAASAQQALADARRALEEAARAHEAERRSMLRDVADERAAMSAHHAAELAAQAAAMQASLQDAVTQRAQERKAWRAQLAAARWQARGLARSSQAAERRRTEELAQLRRDHAAALQSLRQEGQETSQRLQDEIVAGAHRAVERQAAFDAERQQWQLTQKALHTQVLGLHQQAFNAERAWEERLGRQETAARAMTVAMGRAWRRQHGELLYRTELAATLGRRVLDLQGTRGSRALAPLVGLATGLRGRTAGERDAWRQLAQEALLHPDEDWHLLEGGELQDLMKIDMTTKRDLRSDSDARSVDELLQLDDAGFVRAAYLCILGREPDAQGRQHYMDALLAGDSRLQVLEHLSQSDEGRARKPALNGFDVAMRTLRRSRLPVVGRLFRPAPHPPAALGTRRVVETLAADLERSQSRIDERLASIERVVLGLRMQAERQSQASIILGELSRHRWPEETDLWRTSLQLVDGDTERFLREAFDFLLDRAPHGYELMHFRERLSQGGTRAMVVARIVQSAEFTAKHPPLTPRTPEADAAADEVPGETPAAAAAASTGLAGLTALPSLPIYAEPVVSVVIPVYGKLDYTLRCLRSIARHRPGMPFEVIVIDDCSPDDSADVLAQVPGVRLLRNERNLGFIRSCNRAAAQALGTYLCLLNNDTEVHARWLDELLATFGMFPGTGLVGSKLVYPDGKLQEAGGIIWSNGNAWNFGRGQDPDLPVFNYAREVDYCSGASIMLPRALWEELGGFDEHYAPAYCEDSDLALKVRERGLRVIYQPTSVVVHHEGISSGTDTASGTKAYQVTNSRKLFERWKERLAQHQPDAQDVDAAKDRMHRLRVLVLEHCNPSPDQDAGSVSVFNMLLLLREMGFQVTFIAEDNFLHDRYTVLMQRAGIEVLYGPYVTSVRQHVQEHGARYDLCFLFRPVVVERHAETLRRHCPRAKLLFYTHDIHHIRMEREAALLDSPSKAAEAAAMKAREFRAIRAVDSTIVVSTAEMEVLQPQLPDQHLQMLPLLLDVPGTRVGFEARKGILFVGGFQHTPNVDAVQFFVAEVMPLVRERLPGVKFHIVGSKPPEAITALAAADVIVHGFVEDLKPLLDEVRVSVAPLRYGAGVKGKVGTALANGLPTVCTPIAAEGMALVDKTHVLIGSGPSDLADCIALAHEDRTVWLRLSHAGVEFARASWGAQASHQSLAQVIRGIGLPVQATREGLVLFSAERFAPRTQQGALPMTRRLVSGATP